MLTTSEKPCEFWFIRHGETDWNAAHRMQGRTDIALNAAGVEQAQALVPLIQRAHKVRAFSALYATPLCRAQQTAQPLVSACNLTMNIATDLQERAFGIIEGQPYDTISQGIGLTPELNAVAQAIHRREPDYLPPLGQSLTTETLRQFYQRTTDCALQLSQLHAGERVIVITHGGVLDCLWRWANGVELSSPRTWRIVNASINIIQVAPQLTQVLAWGLHANSSHPALDEDVR